MNGKKWDIDCVIYDCDGVLFDSLDVNRRLYNHIAGVVGREPLRDDELSYCHTHTVHESIHHMFQEDASMEERALHFWKHDLDFSEFILYLKMEPHLIETLRELRNRGIATAISTNRTTTMKQIMRDYGLSPYFDMVVTALDVERPKPDPESVIKILTGLKVERERVVYVGDSEVDRKTARSSEVKFVAYKDRALEADGFIDDHLSLLDFLSNGR